MVEYAQNMINFEILLLLTKLCSNKFKYLGNNILELINIICADSYFPYLGTFNYSKDVSITIPLLQFLAHLQCELNSLQYYLLYQRWGIRNYIIISKYIRSHNEANTLVVEMTSFMKCCNNTNFLHQEKLTGQCFNT